MGFPAGVAEHMVLTQFRKYQDIYQRRTGNKIPEGIEQVRRPGAPKDLKVKNLQSSSQGASKR